jgi:RHS repeat-associated protein
MSRKTRTQKRSSARKSHKRQLVRSSGKVDRRTLAVACVLVASLIVTVAYAGWMPINSPDTTRDKAATAKNDAANPVKNVATLSADKLASIPPEALRPHRPEPRGYNASQGGLPPGALPPGVVLPGITDSGRTMAQGYGVYDGVRHQFTGKERDTETGLDYFGARYYSSVQGRFTSVDPSRKSIDINNPQTWNRYSYALNNPLAYVDRNGKWPTRIHNLIIDRALQGLSAQQRKWIKQGSWAVDDPTLGGQFAHRANEHGQTIRGQSQDQAAQNAGNFIKQHATNAREYAQANSHRSFFEFGMAFHTLSDMTSPAHEGYQVWNPLGVSLHRDTEKSISHFRMGLAVGATIALFNYTYGPGYTSQAVNYTPGSENDPGVEAIRAEFSLPGSDPRGEAEALYLYRRGLDQGLSFDWSNQRSRRRRRQSEHSDID